MPKVTQKSEEKTENRSIVGGIRKSIWEFDGACIQTWSVTRDRTDMRLDDDEFIVADSDEDLRLALESKFPSESEHSRIKLYKNNSYSAPTRENTYFVLPRPYWHLPFSGSVWLKRDLNHENARKLTDYVSAYGVVYINMDALLEYQQSPYCSDLCFKKLQYGFVRVRYNPTAAKSRRTRAANLELKKNHENTKKSLIRNVDEKFDEMVSQQVRSLPISWQMVLKFGYNVYEYVCLIQVANAYLGRNNHRKSKLWPGVISAIREAMKYGIPLEEICNLTRGTEFSVEFLTAELKVRPRRVPAGPVAESDSSVT